MAKSWKHLTNDATAGIYPALEAMTDNELRLVRSAKNKVTSSNCGWMTFAIAPLLSDIANNILRTRSFVKRKDKQGGAS